HAVGVEVQERGVLGVERDVLARADPHAAIGRDRDRADAIGREHAVADTGPGHRPDLAAVAGVGLAHPDVVVTVADTHTADDDQIAVGRDRDTRADVVAIHDLHRAGHDLLPDDR